jgi:modulator of FtsH protease HflC
MKRFILVLFAVIVVIVLGRWCCYTVDASEYAYVTVLGEHQATYDGANQSDGAGLKVGLPWPILQVQRLDRRLQHFDLPPTEQLTHDPKGNTVDKILLIEAYVCWKISDADGVDLFVKSVGTAARARDILAPEITGKLGAVVGQKRMDDFITTATTEDGKSKVDVTVEKLRNDLINGLKARLRDKYGIDLVDIRLRRFNHPVSVRNSIFERIKSERTMEAEKYESEGKLKAANIISKAEEDVRLARADANTKAEKIKADADVTALRIRSQAYAQNTEFAEFLKRMEGIQAIVGGEKSMLLLSTHWPMFEAMFKEPRPKLSEKDKKNDK